MRFISMRFIVPCLATILVIMATATVHGQEAPDLHGTSGDVAKKPLRPEDLLYELKGADIPRYNLVRQFFIGAYSTYQDSGWPYDVLLRELGIERASDGETALTRALEQAGELIYGPGGPIEERWDEPTAAGDMTEVSVRYGRNNKKGYEVDPRDEQAFKAMARKYHVDQAKAVADIYFDLLEGLSESGVPEVNLERYLYNKIAAHSAMASDEPLDKNTLRYDAAAFEVQLESRQMNRR